jgi:uncharacterized repeat protein (TIGR04138 family)
MKVSGFNEAVAEATARNTTYAAEGYQFLRESLEASLKRRSKSRQKGADGGHVSAGELLEGFRFHALKNFGPMTPLVLEHWGIRSCSDIGRMVFLLVEAGAFGRTESDSVEDFEAGFDFHEAFVIPFLPGVSGATTQPTPVS